MILAFVPQERLPVAVPLVFKGLPDNLAGRNFSPLALTSAGLFIASNEARGIWVVPRSELEAAIRAGAQHQPAQSGASPELATPGPLGLVPQTRQ